ncbi:TBC1 domain family member 2B-like, partial [Saccostrea cucullata]|uniref:TBC1 domain family member 2B-like n=1 Tax=Saccostrea cuccullata TaxID=36930 RepID=UPI002ECFD67A
EKYEWVRKACDSRTLVGLARTEDVDGRYFASFPTPDKVEGDLESGLKVLLSSLPKDGFSKCLEYFTTQALIEGNIEEERGGYWSFGGPGVDFAKTVSRGPEERVEIICLQALISHSNERHHCFEMMKMGVLPLLQQTYHKRKYSIVMRRQIARILGNLSVHEELHPEIIKGGWVSLLYKWSKSSDLQLSLHASRALVNLDRDDGTFLYPSGVYLVHPTKRSKDPVMADVVFVHGLLGGPFKTWRQQDRKMPDKDNVAEGPASVRKGTYTFCWPKDWLSNDVPFVRILSVEYDTNLSTWNANCPYETEKRSLPRRASELQKKLKAAGVGSRPIIWVTHSMGGLLVKKVLCQSNLSPDCSDIVRNTSGIIFYSTPHRGSALANISNRGSRIFSPTVEVQELSQEKAYIGQISEYIYPKDMEKNIEYEKNDLGKDIEGKEKEEQVIDGFQEGLSNDEDIVDRKKEEEESQAEIVKESDDLRESGEQDKNENEADSENEADDENEADNEREESLKVEEGEDTDNVKTNKEVVIKTQEKETDKHTGEDNKSKDVEDSKEVKTEVDMKPKDSSQMESSDSMTLSKSEVTSGDMEDSDVISNGFEVIPADSVNIPFTHYVDHKNLIRSAGQADRFDGEMELTHLLKGYKNSNKELKDFHRKNSWDTHHTIRGQLWVKVCETLHKAKGNLYDDYEKDLFHQRNTDDIALPPFVDFNNLTSYHLSEQGTKTVAKILAIIQNTNPEILYCPTLYAKLSIFLHYMGPSDAFNCIYALLRSKDACIMQTKVAVEASKLVLRDLTKKYAKSAYVYLVRHSSDITSVFDTWMWWLFSDLPFPHIVRILDCYLVEGVKVLYRIVLAILILFTKYSVSAKQHHHGVITDTFTVSERIRQFCTNMPFPVEKLLK